MIDYNELPLGLGLAFAANRMAMDRFVDMTDDEKAEFLERSRSTMSKQRWKIWSVLWQRTMKNRICS